MDQEVKEPVLGKLRPLQKPRPTPQLSASLQAQRHLHLSGCWLLTVRKPKYMCWGHVHEAAIHNPGGDEVALNTWVRRPLCRDRARVPWQLSSAPTASKSQQYFPIHPLPYLPHTALETATLPPFVCFSTFPPVSLQSIYNS